MFEIGNTGFQSHHHPNFTQMSGQGQDTEDGRCWHCLEQVLICTQCCLLSHIPKFLPRQYTSHSSENESLWFLYLVDNYLRLILYNSFKQILSVSWNTSPSSSHWNYFTQAATKHQKACELFTWLKSKLEQKFWMLSTLTLSPMRA